MGPAPLTPLLPVHRRQRLRRHALDPALAIGHHDNPLKCDFRAQSAVRFRRSERCWELSSSFHRYAAGAVTTVIRLAATAAVVRRGIGRLPCRARPQWPPARLCLFRGGARSAIGGEAADQKARRGESRRISRSCGFPPPWAVEEPR
jgi:hypothetical protein